MSRLVIMDDMSPDKCLVIYDQPDGDLVIEIGQRFENGNTMPFAADEYCERGGRGGRFASIELCASGYRHDRPRKIARALADLLTKFGEET